MLYQVIEEGYVAVLTIGGEMDLDSGNALKESLEKLSDQIKIVILDLKNISYINSSGIGQLVSALKACTSRERRFRLADLSDNVLQILTMTKLDRVFAIYKDVEAAKLALYRSSL